MSKDSLSKRAVPAKVEKLLVVLGVRLAVARKRRRMTQAELAERMGVSIPSVRAIESGNSGVAFVMVLTAAWALGLEGEFDKLFAENTDDYALFLEKKRLPAKVYRPRGTGPDV